RIVILGRVEPLEPAADGNAHVLGRCAAELEATDRGEAAREVVFEDRRVGAGDAELGDQASRVSSGAVGPLPNEEVLSPFKIAARKAELAERLLERAGDEVTLSGRERNVARV